MEPIITKYIITKRNEQKKNKKKNTNFVCHHKQKKNK